MMPEHCKEVSPKTVDFPLLPAVIERELMGQRVYRVTRYLILKNGQDLAVVKVKTAGDNRRSLFRQITGVKVVSLPEDSFSIELPGQDVLDGKGIRNAVLAAVPENMTGRPVTAVVRGKFEHVTFITMK